MADLVLHHSSWIAVCDGSKALPLKNVGSSLHPSLETHDVIKQENLATHSQGSSPPGERLVRQAAGERR